MNTLIYCMGCEADDILDSLTLSVEFKEVTEKLTSYFMPNPKRNVIFERVKFNQRVQHDGKRVDSFVTRLFKLAENCDFGTLHDQLIRDRIMIGSRDHKLSEKFQLDAELTLEKARQHEAVKSQQSVVRGKTIEGSLDYAKSKPVKKTTVKTTSQQKGQRCGREQHIREKMPSLGRDMSQVFDKGTFCKVLQN